MSTSQVPGYKESNQDELSAGCWAESEDGSRIVVLSYDNNVVFYEIFNVIDNPIVFYHDSMPKKDFMEMFSDSPDGWIWHDKKPFPWDTVSGKNSNLLISDSVNRMVDKINTTAEKVAKQRKMRSRPMEKPSLSPLTDKLVGGFKRMIGYLK